MNSPSGFTFPGHNKLTKSSVYEFLLRNGRRVNSGNFTLILDQNKLGYPRYGHIVSRKVSASSVKRNRIKRVLREFFRQNKSTLDSLDLLIVVKKDISEYTSGRIHEELTNSLRTAVKC